MFVWSLSQYVKIICSYIYAILKRTVRFLKRLTLYELLWACVIFFFYCVLILWPDEHDAPNEPDFWYYSRTPKVKITDESSRNATTPEVTKLVKEWLDPIIVWWNTYSRPTNELVCSEELKCLVYGPGHRLRENVGGAYLFYASSINFTNLPLPRQPHNTLWALSHEESPRNIDELMHAETLALFNISATFSRHSDVPFPLQQMGSLVEVTSKKYFVETSKKNAHLKKLAPILYIHSNCETTTERDDYVKILMKYINVDSYGKCLKNKESLPFKSEKDYLNNFKNDEYLRFISRYKFHMAIENAVCSDYVTEKFWRPIHVGSVPIYFGSPLIKDCFPNNKSAILLEDFPSPKILSDHLKELLANDTLYEEYLEHKIKGIITNDRLFTEMRLRPYQTSFTAIGNKLECFVCKKLHEFKKNPNMQSIVTKCHYDCPIPISALSLKVNPANLWVGLWKQSRITAQYIYHTIRGNATFLNASEYNQLRTRMPMNIRI